MVRSAGSGTWPNLCCFWYPTSRVVYRGRGKPADGTLAAPDGRETYSPSPAPSRVSFSSPQLLRYASISAMAG